MKRGYSALALVLLIAVMVWWSRLNLDGTLGWRDLVDHPERRDGEAVILSLVTVGPVLAADRYVVFHGSLPIEVQAPAAEVSRGEDVTVGGTFSAAERVVVAQWVEHRPDRTGKKVLGLLAILVLGVLLPACWRLGPEGLESRG